MRIKQIREFQIKDWLSSTIASIYAAIFSPVFTKWFIYKKIRPNIVTVLMMISGLIGALFFSLPNIIIKAVGALFIHLWFILDLSDGEVARITKTYSKFGNEIDHTAHVINHPCFTVSFIISTIWSKQYSREMTILFIILMILETMGRHLCSFENIYNLKMGTNNKTFENKCFLERFIRFFIVSLMEYPFFALLFVVLFIIDNLIGTRTAFYLLLFVTMINILIIPYRMFKWVIRIAKM